MRLFSLTLTSLVFLLAAFCVATELESQETPQPGQIETIYDDKKDQTTVRLKPVHIGSEKAQYQSVHIATAFSYPGKQFKKPEIIDFEVQTVVKTKLKIDLYVVFVIDGEEIFLSSDRAAVKRPLPGKRWIGERLVFRMPHETLMKLAKARAVEIKMDSVRFPLRETALDNIRVFAKRLESLGSAGDKPLECGDWSPLFLALVLMKLPRETKAPSSRRTAM